MISAQGRVGITLGKGGFVGQSLFFLAVLLIGCGEVREAQDTGSPDRCLECHGGWGKKCASDEECTASDGDTCDPEQKKCISLKLSGLHALHAAKPSFSRQGGCSDCHPVPEEILGGTHLFPSNHHDVIFGRIATQEGKLQSNYDPVTGECRNVYCHGPSFEREQNANRWFWFGPFDGNEKGRCGTCHTVPPAKHMAIGKGDCLLCHPFPEKGLGKSSHVNGVVELKTWQGLSGQPKCGACHGTPPSKPHPQRAACGLCHKGYRVSEMDGDRLNATLHMNGRADVVDSIKDIPCGSCHGVPPSTPHLSNPDCSLCHPNYESSAGSQMPFSEHLNGKIDVQVWTGASDQPRCGACHGIPPSTKKHQDSKGCISCHVVLLNSDGTINTSSHMNGRIEVIEEIE